MTPDSPDTGDLRARIIHELDGMVSEFIAPNEFGGWDVDYGHLADVVLPVVTAELHRTQDMLLDAINRAAGLAEQVDGQRDTITGLRADLDAADTELAEVDTLTQQVERLRAEVASLRTKVADAVPAFALQVAEQLLTQRDRAAQSSQRGSRASGLEDAARTIRHAAETWAERAPEQNQARPPLDDDTKAAIVAALETGIACGDGPEYWPDCGHCDATGRINECPDCEGIGKVRPEQDQAAETP